MERLWSSTTKRSKDNTKKFRLTIMMKTTWIFLSVQFVLIVFGILLVCGGQTILELIIEKRFLTLTKNAPMFETWQKSPYKVTFDVYFWNWTNHKELRLDHVKPTFQQIGPYCFNKDVEKDNIVWNDNGTVTYRVKNTWYFDEKRSKGKLDDQITTINALAMSIASKAREWSFFLKKSFRILSLSIHITKSAGQLLFDGYDDPLTSLAKTFGDGKVPDKMGWYAKRNASAEFDGVFNVGTKKSFGKLYRWNYDSVLRHYGETCRTFKSQAMFTPKPGANVTVFLADICRDGILDYENDEIVENLTGRKYIIGGNMLDNGTVHPENECFCNGDCLPSGVVNVTACKNAPAFWSLPHFHKADPFWRQQVHGMNPNGNLHDFYIILEPSTGVPLKITGTSQGNIFVRNDSAITFLQDFPDFMAPTFWYEQKAQIGPDQAFQLRLLLSLPVVTNAIGFISICVGLLWMIYMFYKNLRLQNNTKHHPVMMQIEQQIPLTTTETTVKS